MGELLHAILTETPMSVTAVRPSIPNALSDIIAKLLLKDPEKRYQSAYGVHKDLLRCKAEFDATGNVSPFEIAQNDAIIVLRQPRYLTEVYARVFISCLESYTDVRRSRTLYRTCTICSASGVCVGCFFAASPALASLVSCVCCLL